VRFLLDVLFESSPSDARNRDRGAVDELPCYGLVQVSAGLDGVPLARKPNVVDPDAGTDPL
jgi:hypothetical protein